jgi:hypothetical protein
VRPVAAGYRRRDLAVCDLVVVDGVVDDWLAAFGSQ